MTEYTDMIGLLRSIDERLGEIADRLEAIQIILAGVEERVKYRSSPSDPNVTVDWRSPKS